MRMRNLWLLTGVSAAAFMFQAGLPASVQGQSSAALTGTVSSTEEGNMEGVLVTAKKEGATIATTVVTDDKGNFSFPADRLGPGKYTISIRASGYILSGPKDASIAAGQPAKADLKLAKGRNPLSQLSNAELMISAPGTDKQKAFLTNCVGCHTLQRVFTSSHTAEEFRNVFKRMGE